MFRSRVEFGMSVHFVYRSYYEGPTGRSVKRFPDATLLEWFQNHWRPEADPDAAYRLANDLFASKTGRGVYGAHSLFQAMAAWAGPVPQSSEELAAFLSSFDYPEGELWYQPGAVQ